MKIELIIKQAIMHGKNANGFEEISETVHDAAAGRNGFIMQDLKA
jgi:hypothetical protein